MPQNIYINANSQSPRSAFVLSELNPTPVTVYDIVYGDKLALNIYLVDGEGNFDATSGLAGYTVKASVGLFGQAVAAMQDSWTLTTNGWTGSIELNTTGIKNLLAGAESVDAWLEIEITDPSGNRRTYGQQKIELLNQTIDTGAVVPTPQSDFFTQVETNQKFVQNRSAITGLTGGGATNLDGIVTLGIATGIMAAVVLSATLSYYQLVAGTDAESSPWTIRPDDYAASTNEKVWKLRTQDVSGYTHTQNDPVSVWNVIHNFGYRPAGITVWINNAVKEADIDHVSLNQFNVTFRGNQTGFVRVR